MLRETRAEIDDMTQATHLPHITHYRIVSGSDAAQLHADVEAAIHNGWQPFGSLSVDRADGGVTYIQPVVRYAEWSV